MKVNNILVAFACLCFALAGISVGILIHDSIFDSAASQKTAMLPASQNIGVVIAKTHLGGYWYTMKAQTGRKTVSMPVYDSIKWELVVRYDTGRCATIKRQIVDSLYWTKKRIDDTLILK
jgi:hypothetical protein